MSGLNLAHLPFDIYTIIFNFLHPMDIMAIGQTCKTLHAAFSMRSIWVEALNRTMSANSIFGPTFHRANDPSDPMTLQELQHASTAPMRMLRLIEDKQRKKCYRNRKLRPLYRTVVPLPVDAHASTENKIFIVPGGRYVVTNACDTLMVIDLERFFKLGVKDPREYTATCFCRTDKIFLVGPSPDGTRLRVIVSRDLCTGFDDFIVYEYNPASHKLSILRSVSLQTNHRDHDDDEIVPSLAGNLFVFVLGYDLYVWDFVRDLYVSWEVNMADVQDIIIVDDKIIPITAEHLGFWEIPPLLFVPPLEPSNQTQAPSAMTPQAPRIRVPIIEHLPSSILPMVTGDVRFPSESYTSPYESCCVDDWFCGPEHPLVYDTLQFPSAKLRKDIAFRQQIYLPGKAHTSERELEDESTRQQIQRGHVDLFGCYPLMDTGYMRLQRSRYSEGRIVVPWSYNGAVYLLSTPGPGLHTPPPSQRRQASTPSTGIAPNETPLTSSDNPTNHPTLCVDIAHRTAGSIGMWNKFFCFDPPSGRLCLITGDGASLLIHDFLLLPQFVAQKHYSTDGINLDWKDMEARGRKERNEQVERNLFDDLTDDEFFYDESSDEEDL